MPKPVIGISTGRIQNKNEYPNAAQSEKYIEAVLLAGGSAFGLDAATGHLRCERPLAGPDYKLGDFEENFGLPMGSLPDILTSDGTTIWMRDLAFDKDLQPAKGPPELRVPGGLLEDSYFKRTPWTSGGEYARLVRSAAAGDRGERLILLQSDRKCCTCTIAPSTHARMPHDATPGADQAEDAGVIRPSRRGNDEGARLQEIAGLDDVPVAVQVKIEGCPEGQGAEVPERRSGRRRHGVRKNNLSHANSNRCVQCLQDRHQKGGRR